MDSQPEQIHPQPFGPLATWCSVLVTSLGVLGLLSWFTDLPSLSSILSSWMPMAPSTAFSFIFLGAVLFLAINNRVQGSRLALAVFVVALVSLFGLLTFVGYGLGTDLTYESRFFPASKKIGAYLVYRMSPITGVLFFLAGAALQTILMPGGKDIFRKLAEILAALVTVAGFVGTLGYLLGSPLLYGGNIIPLSCTTTVGFLLLGSGLLAAAGPQSFLLGAIVGPSVRARLLRAFLPVMVGLVLLQAMMAYLMPDIFVNYRGLTESLLALGFLLITSVVVTLVGRVIGQDIDRSEEALFQAKEELERTFDAIPDFIAVLDTQYHILKVNKAMGARLGLETNGIIAGKCYEAIHSTMSPPEFCPHTKLLADGQEHTVEIHEEKLGGDFIVTVSPLHDSKGQIIGSVHVAHDITARKRAEMERDQLISQLQEALAQIKTLKGFLPICAYCKKIRDDEGYWQQIEEYIREHSDAEFSHGICPDCLEEHHPSLAQVVSGPRKILVVDDEDSIRDVLSRLLEKIGYEVVGAKDGREAIDLYQEAKEANQPFAAAIFDSTLPGEMGAEKVIEKLLAVDPQIKAIASSDYADDEITADFKKNGFRAIIVKPFNVVNLSEVLERVING
ncbi:MAG: response regulator [Desulfobaccales bacterium]